MSILQLPAMHAAVGSCSMEWILQELTATKVVQAAATAAAAAWARRLQQHPHEPQHRCRCSTAAVMSNPDMLHGTLILSQPALQLVLLLGLHLKPPLCHPKLQDVPQLAAVYSPADKFEVAAAFAACRISCSQQLIAAEVAKRVSPQASAPAWLAWGS